MRGRRGLAVAIVVLTLLAGAGLRLVPASPGPHAAAAAAPSGPVVVAPAFVPGPTTRVLGPLPASDRLAVAVALAPRDPAGLAARTALEYTPGSPAYHAWLAPAAIAARYGPEPGAYARAVAYFASFDLTVTTSPDGQFLDVAGPAPAVGAAFGTSFVRYDVGGLVRFSHPTPATLPAGIPWAGAIGLGNVSVPRPLAVRLAPVAPPQPAAGCSTATPLAPCAVARAYNTTGLLARGTNGTGFTIGVVDTYDGSEPQTTLASDLASFAAGYGLPVGTVRYLYPVPTSRALNATSTGWGTEEALDLEWSRAAAPGATIDMTFAPDATSGLYAAVDALVATQAVNVLTLSWGEPDVGVFNAYAGPCSAACNATTDGSYTLLHPVLADAAAEGIGVFAASGDCGSAGGTSGWSTGYPASDPAVTGVGGTDLTFVNGSYGGETGWTGNASGATYPGCQNQGGSGGGFAPFPRPWWQSAPGLPTSPATRGVPDVAAVGGTPVAIVYHGTTYPVAGTSEASPIWAGFAALLDNATGVALGSLNPGLYAVARNASAAGALHDVTSGWNGYAAGTGWDPVTGLGTPNVGRLAPLLAAERPGFSDLSVSLGVTPRFGAAPLTATFYVHVTGGVAPDPIMDVAFGDGTAALTSNGTLTHTYAADGAYVAQAVVFDAVGNASVSGPALVDVGGSALAVALNATPTAPGTGQVVTLAANVSGGIAPYAYAFYFGDGSYLNDSPTARVDHRYPVPGVYCASVVAVDASVPASAGLSDSVRVAVGGANGSTCPGATALTANLSSAVVAADLPGDLPLSVATAGGTPPFTVRYASDDPYVTACDCGIFRTAGPHTVTAFVNDSVNQEATARLNVTLYPALVGTFSHTALAGPAPLAVTFGDLLAGGHGADANATNWTFGDGGSATGARVVHTFDQPGFFTVLGIATDAGGGTASAAFLIDVAPAGTTGALGVGAMIAPAVDVPAGTPVNFTANATGGVGPYTIRWSLGDGDSAFGPDVQQTYGAAPCLAAGTCPLAVTVSVTDAAGAALAPTVTVPGPIRGRATALAFDDSVTPTNGTTPLRVSATATATGLPGVVVQLAFGDGSGAVGAVAAHTYYAPGNYTVTDRVTDPLGDVLVRTHAVAVVGSPRSPPTVIGGPNRSAGIGPLAVAFAATALGGGGPPYSFAWAFGDGDAAAGANVTHTYLAAGRFNATVTATDALGDTTPANWTVVVYNVTPVSLVLTVDRSSVAAGGAVGASLWAAADCTPASVPGCGARALAVALGFVPPTGGTAPATVAASVDPGTGLYQPLNAPASPGAYRLEAWVTSANYSGSVSVPVTVVGPDSATPLLPFVVDPGSIVLLGVGAGALAVAAAVVARGRPVSPSPRPAGRGGRRAG